MGFPAMDRGLADRIGALLRPRPMEPEERVLRGRHLRTAVGVTIPALAISAMVTELAGSGVAPSVALAMLPVAGAYLLERRGRLEAAGFVLMATILGLGHWLLYDGDGLLLHVSDNGIGIEPRHQEQVFELFDKMDSRSEGTGVGLAVARRIVELHGGRVWVESKGSGHGATFWVSLPDGPADTTAPPGPSEA